MLELIRALYSLHQYIIDINHYVAPDQVFKNFIDYSMNSQRYPSFSRSWRCRRRVRQSTIRWPLLSWKT